jgi:hypothetical protein
MPTVLPFPSGGFRYISGAFQYSGGVAAEPGFEIERVRFHRLLPLAEGFAAIEAYLKARGRPTTAFCACELRSSVPFTLQGFTAFNREYVKPLERWGLYRDGVNPVARSNVCPVVHAPAEPSFYAFSYTVPVLSGPAGGLRTFVVAGGAELQEGTAGYNERVVCLGDRSEAGLREKARFVLGEMERRMSALGAGWPGATATQVYTVYNLYPFLADEIARRGAMGAGLTWHFARPPVDAVDFEMDVRSIAHEHVI